MSDALFPGFGEATYRQGGLERLQESFTLLRSEQIAGSVYMGGRSVEALLRALIWKHDPGVRANRTSLDTGHDLREMLIRVQHLGLLRIGGRDDEFVAHVQRVGRLWFNNMRFAPTKLVEGRWRRMGEVHKRRTLKQAAADFYNSCSTIVKRCEALCHQ